MSDETPWGPQRGRPEWQRPPRRHGRIYPPGSLHSPLVRFGRRHGTWLPLWCALAAFTLFALFVAAAP